jgi:DNA repair exonuclease SbcCD ATPase subunit
MKISLKNFRCYEKAQFDFGENGLTLISGGSGKGKSTLMAAIEFALFGTGTKLQTYGKRSCSVEIEVNDELKIFRQKAPNRLIVNDLYEDEAGETIIKEKFGSNMMTCYIPQNIRKTFILMSPAERLDFLESLISTDTDIQEIKTSTKTVIKKLCDEHNEAIGALKVADKTLATVCEPEKPPFCSKHPIADQQALLSKLSARVVKYNKEIQSASKQIDVLKREQTDISMLESTLNEKENQLVILETDLLNEQTNVDGYIGEVELTSLKELLRSTNAFYELSEQHKSNLCLIEEMRNSEVQVQTQKINELKGRLWCDLSENEAMEQEILWKDEVQRKRTRKNLTIRRDELQRVLPQINLEDAEKRAETLTADIENLKKDIELCEYPLYHCPNCNVSLRFTGKSLLQSDKTELPNSSMLKATLKTLSTELNNLTTKINNTKTVRKLLEEAEASIEMTGEVDDEADESLQSISDYISQNKRDAEEIIMLEKSLNIPSKSLQMLMKKNDEILNKMKKEKYSEDVEILKENIKEQEKLKTLYDSSFSRKLKLNEQISKIKKDISTLNQKYSTTWGHQKRKVSELTDEITNSETLVDDLQKKRTDDLRKIENYKTSIEYHKQYNTWKGFVDQKTLLSSREEELRKRYSAACSFREKILEAESIAITNLITTINTHAQFYLDHFFQEEPINIHLVAFKETKDSTKPQINIEIEYKGIEHDLTMLSGGELSRVILAFTLALAEIHNTPFVMLDESTSSLDQELTGSVVDGLKENFGNKLVLLIAHQVVQGAFDNVIKL